LNKKTSLNTSKIKKYRNALLSNKDQIKVTDFGAGSRVFKSDERSVAAIAKTAGISLKRAILIAKITNYFKASKILEIGTSLGIATAAMSYGNPRAKIITLEGCKEIAKIAKEQFDKAQLKNIELIIGEFKNTLPKALKNNSFDLIFFDGNHQKEATIEYFEQCLISNTNNAVYIFDDIHWNKEMEDAWDYIRYHREVRISIDTYQWGIIFFRKEQQKEHFTVRF
jgi:predicted O-methyltransferase YrrM